MLKESGLSETKKEKIGKLALIPLDWTFINCTLTSGGSKIPKYLLIFDIMKNIIYHHIAFKILKIKILNYPLIKLVEQNYTNSISSDR